MSSIIIDVRTKEEFSQGHIEGSLNIPLDTLGKNMIWLIKDAPIVVVRASGARSGMAKSILDANGFLNVKNGGAWDNLGVTKAGSCPIK